MTSIANADENRSEVEITSEMLNAGAEALGASYLAVIDGIEPLSEIARTVFEAMLAARK